MNRKILYVPVLLLAVTINTAMSGSVEAENLVIGVQLGLSGAHSVVGHIQKDAMLLAVDEVNAKGVFSGGRRLELDIRNSIRPVDTRNVVNHFIRDKQYPVIIAGGGSEIATEAALWSQRGLTPLIIVSGSEDSITQVGRDYVFRVAPPRSSYCDAAVEYAREIIRPRKIALVTEKSGFGQAMGSVLRKTAETQRWDLVYEKSIDPGHVDIAGIAAAINATKAETVFLAVFPPDLSGIMREIRLSGFSEQAVVSLVPSSITERAFTDCGEDCRGVFSSDLWFSGADSSGYTFRDRFAAKYGTQPDYHAAQAYAAVLAAAAALRNVDETDREAVRISLKETRIGSPYGTVTFTDWEGFTNQNRPATYLYQWTGERFQVVWPERYRTGTVTSDQ